MAKGSGYKGGWARDTRGPGINARRGSYRNGAQQTQNETPENTFARTAGEGIAKGIEKGTERYYQEKANAIQNATRGAHEKRMQAQADALQKQREAVLATMSPEDQQAALQHQYLGKPYPAQVKQPAALDPQTQAAFDALPEDQQALARLHKAGLLPVHGQPKDPIEQNIQDLQHLINFHQHGHTTAVNAGDIQGESAHKLALQHLGIVYEDQVRKHAASRGLQIPGGAQEVAPGQVPGAPAQPGVGGAGDMNPAKIPQEGPPAPQQQSQGNTPAPAGQQQQQPQQPLSPYEQDVANAKQGQFTPEQQTKWIELAAGKKGIKPAMVEKMPALTASEAMQIQKDVASKYSNPMEARYQMYERAVMAGKNPLAPAIPDSPVNQAANQAPPQWQEQPAPQPVQPVEIPAIQDEE